MKLAPYCCLSTIFVVFAVNSKVQCNQVNALMRYTRANNNAFKNIPAVPQLRPETASSASSRNDYTTKSTTSKPYATGKRSQLPDHDEHALPVPGAGKSSPSASVVPVRSDNAAASSPTITKSRYKSPYSSTERSDNVSSSTSYASSSRREPISHVGGRAANAGSPQSASTSLIRAAGTTADGYFSGRPSATTSSSTSAYAQVRVDRTASAITSTTAYTKSTTTKSMTTKSMTTKSTTTLPATGKWRSSPSTADRTVATSTITANIWNPSSSWPAATRTTTTTLGDDFSSTTTDSWSSSTRAAKSNDAVIFPSATLSNAISTNGPPVWTTASKHRAGGVESTAKSTSTVSPPTNTSDTIDFREVINAPRLLCPDNQKKDHEGVCRDMA